MAGISQELINILHGYEDGLSDSQLKPIFGDRYEKLAPAINELLGSNRIQLYQQHDGTLVYKALKAETAAKFEGLGPEQMLVYQVCERAGNKGIWTRDIKVATNIPQHTLTKTLKILEQRSLLKSVRSVVSKSKKLYMVYDMVPAKEITGGPWYSDQEFDHEFVTALADFVEQLVKVSDVLDLEKIGEKVKVSGISKIELSTEELQLIVDTLVYDGRLEEVQSSVLLMSGYSATKKMYKASKPIDGPNFLTATPCGVCPVINQCSEDGLITPSTCIYMTQWLDMPTDEGGIDTSW